MKGLNEMGLDGKKETNWTRRYELVNGNDINVSVKESITEDDTADTTLITTKG